MTQTPPRRAGSTAASTLVLALLLTAPAFGDSLWTVAVVGGSEIRVHTHDAASEPDVLVDLEEMNALLEAVDGQSLSSDAVTRDGRAFVSLGALARLAGMQVVLSRSERRAYLFPASSLQPGAASWTPLQMKKTAAEIEEMHRRDAVDVAAPLGDVIRPALPDAQSSLLVQTGVGYVAGADAATVLDVSGSAQGYRISGNAFVTRGSEGVRYVSGRASLESPSRLWQVEAGDLFGELRGLTRGARLTLTPERRWSPSLAVHRAPGIYRRVTVAYRDRLAWTSHLESTTELASDGSAFTRLSFAASRLHADVFYRRDESRAVRDRGVSGSMNVWRGLTLFAAGRVSTGRTADRWMRGGVSVPLGRGAQLLLDETRLTNETAVSRTHAASLHLPFGRLQIHQRFQAADTAFLNGLSLDMSYRQAQSTASFAVSQRIQLAYQSGLQWLQDGDVRQYREMQATLMLATRTSLRVTSNLPDVLDPRQLTIRLNHDFSKAWNVNGEFGRVSTYQPVSRLDADARRFALLVTRRFDIRTPAGGSTVEGHVLDERRRPVHGAVVRLGPYVTVTDTAGAYEFPHVPKGSYPLQLDRGRMPAGFMPSGSSPVLVNVAGVGILKVPLLQAVGLRTIRGRVFVDHNGNRSYDPDEGLAGAVLLLNDRATMSAALGEFAFFNVPPGQYDVRLDDSRLRTTLLPASATVLAVTVRAEEDSPEVQFIVTPRTIPIRIQPWPAGN